MSQSNPGKSVFQLQQVVQQAVFCFKKQACGALDVQLVNDLVAPLSLVGDAQALHSIINVLLMAAARYTGATRIMLSMEQLLQVGSEVLVEFEVSDNGPGISGESASSLFSYKRCLAEARLQIKEQNGKSEINSLYGVGTTFKFVIKYILVQKEEVQTAGNIAKGSLAGKKVLVAEDNELNQKTIAHLLKREGMLVDIASDGREAVELFEQNKSYDLMLLDLQLPFMDGFQSAIYIRKKLKSKVPIIALTAGFYDNAKARCNEIGIDRYMTKPLQPAELLRNVNYFLVK